MKTAEITKLQKFMTIIGNLRYTVNYAAVSLSLTYHTQILRNQVLLEYSDCSIEHSDRTLLGVYQSIFHIRTKVNQNVSF